MEIKSVIRTFRRWFWLLILGGIIGGTSGLLVGLLQTPTYQSITKVLVTRMRQDSTSDFAYLNDQQLVQTYLELLTTKPIRDAVSAKLQYEVDPKQVQVQQVKDTQIIQITVEDHDPEIAASIANTMVSVLVEQNQELQTGQYTASENALEIQIAQVEEQMNSLQDQYDQSTEQDIQGQLAEVDNQISSIENEITNLQRFISQNSPGTTDFQQSQVAEKQAKLNLLQPILTQYQQIRTNLVFLGKPAETGTGVQNPHLVQLQSTINLYQQIYLNLLNNRESIRLARLQNTPNVAQIEAASIPPDPIRPIPFLYTLLAGFVGLVVASGLALWAEYLDDTLKTPADVSQILGLPVLGTIPEIDPKEKKGPSGVKEDFPYDPQTFNILQINLDYVETNQKIKTIMVVSSGALEGKTTVAVNLALTMARVGKKIALLDMNFRKPGISPVFGLEDNNGLSDVINTEIDIQDAGVSLPDMDGLTIFTSGTKDFGAAGTFISNNLLKILGNLKKNHNLVLIDSAPLFVPDVHVLASKVDGVLLVIQPWHTQSNIAKTSLEQLRQSGANVLGVVLNRIPRSLAYFYDDYQFNIPNSEEYFPTQEKTTAAKKQIEESKQEPKPDVKWNTYPDIFRE